MPQAKLRLTVPESVWIGEVSRAHPGARFRVLAAMPDGEHGVALIELSADDLDAVLGTLADVGHVVRVEELHRSEGTALLQLETSNPLLLFPVQRSGVPLELPFELADGEAVWTLTASRDRLSQLGEQLDAFGIDYRVEYLRASSDPEQLLTDHQRRLLVTAVEAGYYDTPRECSLTELAALAGIAKSTCSETLHRAESKVARQFVADHLGDVEPLARPE